MLSSLSQVVRPKTCFGLNQSRADILELSSLVINFTSELGIFFLELLVLVSLFWVEIIKTGFILEIDVLDLSLISLNNIFHIFLLREQVIQMSPLLIILDFDMVEKCFDIIWLCVTSIFVKSQVVISKLSFVLPDFHDEWFVFALQSKISGGITVDILNLLFHFGNLICDLSLLSFEQIFIVSSIIDLSSRSLVCHLNARHTMVGNWSINSCNFGVVTNTCEIGFFLHGSWLSHARSHPHSSFHSLLLHSIKFGVLFQTKIYNKL